MTTTRVLTTREPTGRARASEAGFAYPAIPMAKTKKKAPPPPKPGRYTAPKPKTSTSSPMWVPAAMFACLGLGVIVIIANYLQLLPGGEAQNEDLFLGLGLLIGGFILSTQYR
jgi:hypothetical protein